MLPKSLRLSRKDLLLVKSQGKKLSTPHFSVTVFTHTPGRVAVVTSTKLSKLAVVRNRLRRSIYQALEIRNSKLEIDLILFPKPSMLQLSRDQISTALNSFLSTLH